MSEGNEILDRVGDIIASLFDVPRDEVSADTSMETLEAWDSLQHMNVVFDVEAAFDIEFEPEAVVRLSDVRSIVDAVQTALSARTG